MGGKKKRCKTTYVRKTDIDQRRTNVSSSAWEKEKEGMEELQYIENEMRAHTDNAITKVWCDLRVKAED